MKFASVLLAAFAGAWFAHAQLEVKLSFDRDFFLAGEDLDVAVKVANFTGGPVTLGQQADWIRFTVERSDAAVVNKLSEVEETGGFTLQHATVGTLHFNLTPRFALQRPGSYRVTAQVTGPKSPEVFTSEPASFEIVSGVRLNPDRTVGVTLPDGTTAKRKYILQQVNFLRKVQLYMRVTDGEETSNLKVTNLGALVSFDPPKWVIDRQNQFHVLHRVDSSYYLYHLFQPDGTLARREVYRFTTSSPELRVNDQGEVAVIGGIRRPSAGDIPPRTTNRPPAVNVSSDLKPQENAKPSVEPASPPKP